MSSEKIQQLDRNPRILSTKTLQNGCTLEEIRQAFLHSYMVYEKLFAFIKDQRSFYTKPEPLRHPLIFYYGHTATVYINKLFDKGLISERVNPQFESIFAVGVDEMDWDDLNETHYDWPSVREVAAYRQIVKETVLKVIEQCDPEINWNSDAWVVAMGIEHEKIHLETSSVIIRRLPIEQISPQKDFVDCSIFTTIRQETPINEMKTVPAIKLKWTRQIKTTKTFGWDNEFGDKLIDLKAYKASSMLVSNGEYLQFLEDNGYSKPQLWDEEGRAWLKSIKPKMPLFWSISEEGYMLRTMSKVMPLPMNWPAEVNNLEATAFCNWKSTKTGKQLRLPTEDEYYAMRELLPKDEHQWLHGQVGNINLEYWFSPSPVDYFKTGDFYDIVGNVWQHCSTPIYPFQNFKIHPVYEDFSTPTFDGRHFLIKGGSFISTGNAAIKQSRYAFRRHFYQFAGFRYIQSQNAEWCQEILDEGDKIVEQFLKIQYLTKNSYCDKILEIVKKHCENVQKKCVTVGCSVGRIVLQMSKYFKQSYGTDYSARYFQMATRLYDKGHLKYKDIDFSIENLQIEKQKVFLYQMNPENPDSKKIHDCSVGIFDGLALRDNTIKRVLKCMKQVLSKKARVICIHTDNRNHIKADDFKDIASKVELIEFWDSPEVGAQNFDVRICMYDVEFTN